MCHLALEGVGRRDHPRPGLLIWAVDRAGERFIRPRLEGRFVLAAADVAEAQIGDRCDGPFVTSSALHDPDGATVFIGEGLPYRIGAVQQDDDVLTLHDGSRIRIVPWPLHKTTRHDPDPRQGSRRTA